MYLAALVTGIRPLPDLLSEPVLALMPGPVFGFLIDRLQHLGKVLEEAGLLLAMIAALAVLGMAYTAVAARRRIPQLGLVAGALAWAVTCLVVLPLSGDGWLGINEGVTTPLVWALLYLIYAVLLEAAATPDPTSVDMGRRRIPLALAGIGVLVLGVRLVPGWYRTVLGAPENAVAGPAPARGVAQERSAPPEAGLPSSGPTSREKEQMANEFQGLESDMGKTVRDTARWTRTVQASCDSTLGTP